MYEYKDANIEVYINTLLTRFLNNIIDITTKLPFVVDEVQVLIFFKVIGAATLV